MSLSPVRHSILIYDWWKFSLSKKHKDHPWGMDVNGQRYEVGYWPADSRSGMFGGNSNWRGPICVYYIHIILAYLLKRLHL